MGIRPRLLLLGRHPVLVTALIAQIAIGFLLACTAGSALVSFWQGESAPSGIAHEELLLVYPLRFSDGRPVRTTDVLDVIRGVNGVECVAAANQSPLGYSSWNSSIGTNQRPAPQLMSSIYLAGERWLETLGASMRSGRDFLPGEYQTFGGDPFRLHDTPLPVILTSSLAQRLYPGQSPLGRPVYLQPKVPSQIIGVIEDVPLPMNGRYLNQGTFGLLLPLRIENAVDAHFLLRVPTADRDQVAHDVEQALRATYPSWVAAAPVRLSSLRAKALSTERNHLQLSALAMAGWLLLSVFAFIVVGQWWLQRHPLELSLRRALGASQRQIAAEFRLEYLLVTSAGIAVGFALSRLLPVNAWPSLSGASAGLCLLVSAMLVALVQLAVTWSVRRTGDIPPHHVSRSPSVRL